MKILDSVYGKCACGTEFDAVVVELRFGALEPEYVLRDVPQASCPTCGTRVFTASVIERVEAAYRDAHAGVER
jgi:hypothetical protein